MSNACPIALTPSGFSVVLGALPMQEGASS